MKHCMQIGSSQLTQAQLDREPGQSVGLEANRFESHLVQDVHMQVWRSRRQKRQKQLHRSSVRLHCRQSMSILGLQFLHPGQVIQGAPSACGAGLVLGVRV